MNSNVYFMSGLASHSKAGAGEATSKVFICMPGQRLNSAAAHDHLRPHVTLMFALSSGYSDVAGLLILTFRTCEILSTWGK